MKYLDDCAKKKGSQIKYWLSMLGVRSINKIENICSIGKLLKLVYTRADFAWTVRFGK